MNSLPTGYGGSSLGGDSYQLGTWHTRTDHNMTNSIHGDSNTHVGNVLNSYNNTIINVGADSESLRIQAWLSPLEPHRRHQDVRNRRLDGVGDWVLRRNEFESWRRSQDGSVDSTLLCYGGQGVGKTYISSLVIDTLREQTDGQNIAVLSLYCDYQTLKDQSAVNMIGGLLKQVISGEARIPGEIKNCFEESRKRGGQGLRLQEMLKLMVKVISSIDRVYICIDAVDELLEHDRSEFISALRQVIQEAPNTRLFLTGRTYIRRELNQRLTKWVPVIHIVADPGDIARYLSHKMDEGGDRDPELMTENLKDDITTTILEKASGMFLLVALNINAILGETSLARRKKMLQKIATTGVDLDSVYAQTLQRIREQDGDRARLGIEVLMWVSHSERPLMIREIQHALAVEVGSTDIDPENIRPQDTVLRSCLGLVVLNEETSTVRLLHYTLQEYLSGPGILPDAHKTLAQTCLTYLNYEHVKRLPSHKLPNLRNMPFLEYSSLYWGSHAQEELSDSTKSLALQLLSRYNNHISSTLLFKHTESHNSSSFTHCQLTGLHCASYFGIVEVMAALIEIEGCDINQRDCIGYTPLMWASWRGNEGVAGLLLMRGDVSPDRSTSGGWGVSRRALCWSERLVGYRFVPEYANFHDGGQTALILASSSGREGVVRLLLTRDDVIPDKPDNNGRTALWWASYFENEEVLKLLLARDDVNPDKPDSYGRTPLWWASYFESEGVLGLLLARDDVNPDKSDNYGRTALWWAAFLGNERVVRLLLARDDVNPNKSANDGTTALFWATVRRNREIVVLLLLRTRLNFPLYISLIPGAVMSLGLLLVVPPFSIGHYLTMNLACFSYFLIVPIPKYPPCASLDRRWVTAALLHPRLLLVAHLIGFAICGVGRGAGLVPLGIFWFSTFLIFYLHIALSLRTLFVWWRLTRNPPESMV